MATTSYPAVGTGGMSETEWLNMFANPDGIVNDTSVGGSFALSRIDAGNIARIGVGQYRLNGYTLEVTVAEDLTVSTTAGTYLIAVKYDPALNVPDGGGGAAALGPCRIVIGTSLSTAGGESYGILYTITRAASQALTNAISVDNRVWTGPVTAMPAIPATPPSPAQAFTRGSVMVETDAASTAGRNRISIRWPNAGGTALEWRPLTEKVAVAFPANSPLVAVDTSPMMTLENGHVFLSGTLKRASGSNLSSGSEVTLGTLPVGWRPPNIVRFVCYANGAGTSQTFAPVKVTSAGVVIMYDPDDAVVWMDLSAINFKVA